MKRGKQKRGDKEGNKEKLNKNTEKISWIENTNLSILTMILTSCFFSSPTTEHNSWNKKLGWDVRSFVCIFFFFVNK